MAHVYGLAAQSSRTRTADSQQIEWRMTRDGAGVEIPWIQALCMEGRVYIAAPGATSIATTPATFGGTSTIDTDEFDFLQTIPATVAVIPIEISVGIIVTGTAAEGGFQAFWGASGVAGANPVSVTPYNLRPGSSNTSNCTIVSMCDDGGTAFVPAGIIARRASNTITVTSGQMITPIWSVTQDGYMPVIEGLASPGRQIAIWAYSQGATTGYISEVFAELPIADIE